MKEMTLKVNSPKENALVSIIKGINKIPCRVSLNFATGFVVLKNVDDTIIDTVIDLISNNYTIEEVHINNVSELFEEISTFEKEEVQIESETKEQFSEESTEELNAEKKVDVLPEQPEFHNENINNAIKKLLKNVDWFLEMEKATEKDILNHIYTCMNEMSMRFAPKRNVQFSVGDIVECNYGAHLSGEVNGSKVHGIVCNIQNDFMAYVVPVFCVPEGEVNAKSYLRCTVPGDLVYDEEVDKESIAILEKGRPLRIERFNKVIGRTTPEFFAKLLKQLAYNTFDFTGNLVEENGVDCEEQAMQTNQEEVTETEQAETITENTEESSSENVVKRKRRKRGESPVPKVGGEEEAILEVVDGIFDKIDKSKTVLEQVEDFMSEIGIPSTSATWLVKQSFVVACDIKKINYENVILELHKLNPNIKEEIIKASLKENFKNWLKKYPQIEERFPKISIMALLKVFAKKIERNYNC